MKEIEKTINSEEAALQKMFKKMVDEQKSQPFDENSLDRSLDEFWKSIEDGSIFENKEINELAEKIIKANPGIMDNF